MSLRYKANILYCKNPQRILKMLIDLFDAESIEHHAFIEVKVAGQLFYLKSMPDQGKHSPNVQMSFCLSTYDRQDISDLEERFQFFIFKDQTSLIDAVFREKISRVSQVGIDGVVIFDDDGRSWSVVYEKSIYQNLEEEMIY